MLFGRHTIRHPHKLHINAHHQGYRVVTGTQGGHGVRVFLGVVIGLEGFLGVVIELEGFLGVVIELEGFLGVVIGLEGFLGVV